MGIATGASLRQCPRAKYTELFAAIAPVVNRTKGFSCLHDYPDLVDDTILLQQRFGRVYSSGTLFFG